MQERLTESEAKVNSFESFLNYSNPLGQAYSLKPGRSLIFMDINYDGLNCQNELRDYHRTLEPFNYSPVPFLDFGKRQFVTITKLANGDLYEGQWNQDGKRDGFGYALIEAGTAIYEGYW